MMEKHLLSKSTYIRSLQCVKSLYLNRFHPKLKDRISKEQLEKFQRGHRIGKMAHRFFPEGYDLGKDYSPVNPGPVIQKTQDLLQEKALVIFEAAFQYQRILSIIDILVKSPESLVAYEVKSSAKISDTYLKDAALQYFVMQGSGLKLHDFQMVYLNPDYLAEHQISNTNEIPDSSKHEGLFIFQSVIKEVIDLQEFTKNNIQQALIVLQTKRIPSIDVGQHCFEPYPCDFYGYCSHPESPDSLIQQYT
jgi:hypothetical protein